MLKQSEALVRQQLPQTQIQEHIRTKIQNYWGVPRESHDIDLLSYWEAQKATHPELHHLSEVVNSTPMTQKVSVEKLFSNVNFIVPTLPGRLGHEIIDDILLVRCNRLFGARGGT